jgi:uncharacterized OB-fold protein
MSVPFPLPDTDWEPLRPFWQAAAAGRLEIPRCTGCGAWNWYPPERCRACGGEQLPWTAVSGRGTVFSFAVVRRAWVEPFAGLAPYATGLVALAEDPALRVVTRFVDCDPERLRIDLPVHAVFRPLSFEGVPGEVVAPLFAPA